MRRIVTVLAVIILAMSGTTAAIAAEEPVKIIESFDFLVDYSGTMGSKYSNTGDTKIKSLGKIFHQINKLIPEELDYQQAGIHTFAPEGEVLDYRPYERQRFDSGIDKTVDEFKAGKATSLGHGFDYFDPAYSDMLRKGAVIVMTDGEYKSGRDSLNEAKIFYLTQPGMCLHFVSFADTQKAQDLIDSMAAISDCSVSVRAADLADDIAATDDFVRRVFYDTIVTEDPVIDFFVLSLPFEFDSSLLDERTIRVAEAVADRLRRYPDYMLKIDGHTCTLGSDAYNLMLSKRRADSVKNYIVSTGIEPSRIITEGFGESTPRYDNSTNEGRILNRRVEFTFFPESEMENFMPRQ